ncbi:MAG: hypothetical protein GVY28_02900 [Alphaproteobacteria bacterium]|jgi:fatty acid desaturase|nr:hypothetical protein [Alphaproteobacteria bacterium]
MRMLGGAAAGIIGLLGLFWSASSGQEEAGYVLGLVVAIASLAVLFFLIKSHYDAKERGETASAATGTSSARAAVSAPASAKAALAQLPDNVLDNAVLAIPTGIFCLGGGIVATYTTGFGWAFGLLMFFGFGALTALIGLKIWTIGFIDDDRQGA